MGASTKVYNNKSNNNSKRRSCAMMLLVSACVATMFAIMLLQKLHERRIFNLFVKDKDIELFSLQRLLQNERDHNKELMRKNLEMQEKLQRMKTSIEGQILEMQSKIDCFQDEQKNMESELCRRQKKTTDDSTRDNFQVTTLTEIFKLKESEIKEHQLDYQGSVRSHQPLNAIVSSTEIESLVVQNYTESDSLRLKVDDENDVRGVQKLRQYNEDENIIEEIVEDINENVGIGVEDKNSGVANANQETHGDTKLRQYNEDENIIEEIVEHNTENDGIGVEDKNSGMANSNQETHGDTKLRQYIDDENKIEEIIEETIENVGIDVEDKNDTTNSDEETHSDSKLREYIDDENKIEEIVEDKKENVDIEVEDKNNIAMLKIETQIIGTTVDYEENNGTQGDWEQEKLKVDEESKNYAHQRDEHSNKPKGKRWKMVAQSRNLEPNKDFELEKSNEYENCTRGSSRIKKLIQDDDVTKFIHKLITSFFDDLLKHLARLHNN